MTDRVVIENAGGGEPVLGVWKARPQVASLLCSFLRPLGV